ncbi:putative NOT transcription complex subunit VIP2 [Hordeum vulgare]|nr:putative NOT transcription complex subunit VIP2 [Hordeum vulgare]
MQRFNDWIADLGIQELGRVGARFTWTNHQLNPTLSVLDRVFMSPDWETGFPLASLRAITRIRSDHVPLVLSSADERSRPPPRFCLETFWLRQPGFAETECTIPLLWDGDRLVQEPGEIRVHVDDFYTELFAARPWSGISLADSIWERGQRVTGAENRALFAPFEEGEVAVIINGMNPSSAPRLDGLSFRFFQTFWHSIKGEIMTLFREFEHGVSNLSRLNVRIITLIPKVPGASDIRQFRPITVIIVVFRILARSGGSQFSQSIVQLMRVLRLGSSIEVGKEAVGGNWCHDHLPELFAENKLVIEHVIPLCATDAIFKQCGFLQIWRPLSRCNERDSIDIASTALTAIAAHLTSPPTPLPPPPPEPD